MSSVELVPAASRLLINVFLSTDSSKRKSVTSTDVLVILGKSTPQVPTRSFIAQGHRDVAGSPWSRRI